MRPSTRMVVLGTRLWRPNVLGQSLALWLDADDITTITLNGSTVSEWRDKSGSSRHASQVEAASQPTYVTVDNRPVVYFNEKTLTTPEWAGSLNGINVFCVVRVVSEPTTFPVLFHKGPINAGTFLYINQSFSSMDLWRNIGNGASEAFFAQPAIGNRYIFNGEILPSSMSVYLDGVFVSGLSTLTANLDAVLPLTIGATENIIDAQFSEFIIVDNALATSNRQRLEGYLAHKWGLTANLPSDHPFKFSPPLV